MIPCPELSTKRHRNPVSFYCEAGQQHRVLRGKHWLLCLTHGGVAKAHWYLVLLHKKEMILTTSSFLIRYRRYSFLVICIIAAIITPPDLMTLILVALPLYMLYEISIKIIKSIERKRVWNYQGSRYNSESCTCFLDLSRGDKIRTCDHTPPRRVL